MSNNANFHQFPAIARQYGEFPDFDSDLVHDEWHGKPVEPPAEVQAAIEKRIETVRAMRRALEKPEESEGWVPPEISSRSIAEAGNV